MTETGFTLPLSHEANRNTWAKNLTEWAGLRPRDPNRPITPDDCAIVGVLSERDTVLGTNDETFILNILLQLTEDSIPGVAHAVSTIDYSLNYRPRLAVPYSPLVYYPSYQDAISLLNNTFHVDSSTIKKVLLAGSMGSLSAHDAASITGVINPEAQLSVVDIVPGTLPETSRRGAYDFSQQDVTVSLPHGQDVIMTNILLGFLGEGKSVAEDLQKVEQFFRNSYEALNLNGALIMVERTDVVTQDMIDLLKKQGFRVFRKQASKFKERQAADQFFAGTGRDIPVGSEELSQVNS